MLAYEHAAILALACMLILVAAELTEKHNKINQLRAIIDTLEEERRATSRSKRLNGTGTHPGTLETLRDPHNPYPLLQVNHRNHRKGN